MKRFLTSKKGIALLATLAVAALASGAFAYFTSTGTGAGSATVGSSTGWTVGQNATPPTGGPLFPDASIGGANIQTDSYTVKNGGSGSQNLTQVVVSVAKADGSAWSSQTDMSKPACNAADFSVGGAQVGTAWTDTSLAGDFTAGQSQTGTVSVELIDNGANQDNCQGVSVPLYFSAS